MMTPATYREAFGKPYTPETILVKTETKTSADSYKVASYLTDNYNIKTWSSTNDSRESFAKTMERMNYVIVLVIACAAALAFIVLFNLNNINITERIREIATLKVMGFNKVETGAYVTRENVRLKQKIDIVVDPEVTGMKNFVVGACESDYHFKNVNIGRDFEADKVADITNAKEGDICPKCGKGKLGMARGVEVGHIFKLGTKYSDALGCIYLDNNGKEHSMVMGCYGIGVSRVLAAIIEQYHDDDGIIWPSIVAPYKIIVVPTKANDEEIMNVANKIYDDLTASGCEVLIDDRNERPGVKFKDADLLGIPLRITVGRRAGEGIVEVKRRDSADTAEITVDEAINLAKEI